MTHLDDETLAEAEHIIRVRGFGAPTDTQLLRFARAIVRLRATIEAVAEALAGDGQAVLKVASAQQVLLDGASASGAGVLTLPDADYPDYCEEPPTVLRNALSDLRKRLEGIERISGRHTADRQEQP